MTKPIITVEHIGHIDIDISNGVPKVGKSDYHKLYSYVLKKDDFFYYSSSFLMVFRN